MTSLGVRSRRAAALSGLIASTLAVVGCSDDPVSPGNQEIVIGGLFSLTGNWSSLGTARKAAMEIGIEDVNAYLAEGNTGLHFAASIKDTKLDPPTALTAITALKDAGVEVVLGPQSSAEVAAIKSYVDANGVLVASQSSTAGTLAIPDDNIFRFTPSDTLEAVALVGLMKADGMATIIPFWRNDAGNIGLQIATRALFSSVGTVKPGVEYAATQPDIAAGRGHAAALKTAFVTAANSLYGASGWTALNPAGDRRFGDFDFFGLSQSGEGSTWTLRAQYDTQRGVLTRVP